MDNPRITQIDKWHE